ncbi:hypothetical protein [Streptosporangium sp. NPDC004631]
MNAEDLTRFGELLQAVSERRTLDLTELHDAGRLLGEVTLAAAAAASHMRTEVAALPKRYILHDDTGDAPEPRIVEARDRLAQMTSLLQQVGTQARRYHGTIGHIGMQVDPEIASD